jgi:hypothetical protein
MALTDCYLWRDNDVTRKLRRSRTVEFRTVAVSDVTLSDAVSYRKMPAPTLVLRARLTP